MVTLGLHSRDKEELIEITARVAEIVSRSGCRRGTCLVYTPHTTAGITINENADPDVVRDILYGLGRIVPSDGYHHGEGNSPAHLKSSLIGCSKQMLVEGGRLVLGTWQGIYFCEFDGPRRRQVLVRIIPDPSEAAV
jgi:secondary thiamine-phosphate synthase enzyme